MSAMVLAELTAESLETAARLVEVLALEDLGPAEADYIVACGPAAIQRTPRLWPTIRSRIVAAMSGARAHQCLWPTSGWG